MTTLCKRPPLPQKRKKLVMKAHAEPKPSEISQQYLEIADEKIRWKTEQNIPSIAPSSIYNHMLSKPQPSLPKSANLIAEMPKTVERKQKRGLLADWKETQKAVRQLEGKTSFLASFDSASSFSSTLSAGKRRIIRLQNKKSLKKPLFSKDKPSLDQKLVLLKEENLFYKELHRDSAGRLSRCEDELRKSMDKTKADQRQFRRSIHELQCKVGRQKQRSSNSSEKPSQFLATFNQISKFNY